MAVRAVAPMPMAIPQASLAQEAPVAVRVLDDDRFEVLVGPPEILNELN